VSRLHDPRVGDAARQTKLDALDSVLLARGDRVAGADVAVGRVALVDAEERGGEAKPSVVGAELGAHLPQLVLLRIGAILAVRGAGRTRPADGNRRIVVGGELTDRRVGPRPGGVVGLLLRRLPDYAGLRA